MYKSVKLLNLPIIILLLLGYSSLKAQKGVQKQSISSLTIEDCYLWSRENYPLIKQVDIIDKITQFNISNASNGNLPQVNINGQVTYQSAVTQLPIDIPNLEIPQINKDQYKIYGEVYQPITNFSNVRTNKAIIKNMGEIEKQKLEVNLYQLKERVNQLYFGVLLIAAKNEQLNIIQSDLDSTLIKIDAALQNGTATLTDKQLLQVERLSLDQQIAENNENRMAYLEMLTLLTGKNITLNTSFIKPKTIEIPNTINRPELKLFNLQKKSILLQEKLLNKSLSPNLSLFAQGGYGRPALNFLSNEFDIYYIAGLKLNWNLSNFYNFKNTQNSLHLSQEKILYEQEGFVLNNNITQSQLSAEVSKYQTLISSDVEIIKIREEVLITSKVQLDNGLITTIDYVKILNDVNKARQGLLLHETQLLLAQFNLKTTIGN